MVRVDNGKLHRDRECTYEYATVPTKAYASSAPRGPALCSADPDPRNKPVPIVPAICMRRMRSRTLNSEQKVGTHGDPVSPMGDDERGEL